MPNFRDYSQANRRCYLKERPDLYWEFRQPTSADELEMEHLTDSGAGDAQIMLREIALTFVSTNIPGDDGPILSPGDRIAYIEIELMLLPIGWVKEIWQQIGAFIPGWGPHEPVE